MTDRLKEIRERADRATEGPWCWINANFHNGRLGHLFAPEGESDLVLDGPDLVYGKSDDGSFIAHARADIPWLLDEVERLRDNEGQHNIDLSNMAAAHELAEAEYKRAEAAEKVVEVARQESKNYACRHNNAPRNLRNALTEYDKKPCLDKAQ